MITIGATKSGQAATAFSDLGGGGSYGGSDFNVYKSSNGSYTPQFEFMAANTLYLSEIDIALYYSGFPGEVDAVLYSSINHTVGSILGIWALNNLPSSGSALASATNISGVQLIAGTRYFLGAQAVSSAGNNVTYGSSDNIIGLTGQVYDLQSGSEINYGVGTTAAFALLGGTTPVPEPASIIFLSLGACVAAAGKWRSLALTNRR